MVHCTPTEVSSIEPLQVDDLAVLPNGSEHLVAVAGAVPRNVNPAVVRPLAVIMELKDQLIELKVIGNPVSQLAVVKTRNLDVRGLSRDVLAALGATDCLVEGRAAVAR